MDGTSAGGSGGNGGGGNITSEFPSGREPEREPTPSREFEAASFTDQQAEQDRARMEQLARERAKPAPEMHLRPGGELEQSVHMEIEAAREAEIAELQARIDRHKERTRGQSRGR